ncbi:MAG: hypothetical protein VX464_00430 [Pseudomonadota bacterium]|nr:hypothetical protein [Pseudomonadota bacterium]
MADGDHGGDAGGVGNVRFQLAFGKRMIRRFRFRRTFAYAFSTIVVASPPVALVAFQWILTLRAMLFPATTCWIATAEHKFLLSAEASILLLYPGFVFWLPIAAVGAGLSYFIVEHGYGRRVVLGAVLCAMAAIALLYFGTGLAADLELQAFHSIRKNC